MLFKLTFIRHFNRKMRTQNDVQDDNVIVDFAELWETFQGICILTIAGLLTVVTFSL